MRILTNRSWTVSELLDALNGAESHEPVTFGSPRKADQRNVCWCGCGGETGGKFCPGHDSKFHSLAKRAARGEAEIPESFVNDDAKTDFFKWYDKEKPIAEARAALKAAKDNANPPTPIVESVKPVEGAELEELLDEVNA